MFYLFTPDKQTQQKRYYKFDKYEQNEHFI